MKTQTGKYLFTIILFFFQVVVFAETPPPPGEFPVDENIWLLVIWALIFGFFVIYKYRSKRKSSV